MALPADLRTSIANYVSTKVTTTVSAIAPDVPTTLNPNEEFSFSITATNSAAPDGIQLINVRYHLSISPTSVAQLKVPASPPARSTTNPADPTLPVGSFVSSMFLFPTDGTLNVGDSDTISGLKGKALALGNATISFHVHADPDLAWLFPTNNTNPSGTRSLTVT